MRDSIRFTPLDILADAWLRFGENQLDSARRMFDAYDRFISVLNESNTRKSLSDLHSRGCCLARGVPKNAQDWPRFSGRPFGSVLRYAQNRVFNKEVRFVLMHTIGFSTGALARGDFRTALKVLEEKGVRAVELSALREVELVPLIDALESIDLRPFDYVALHAPGKLTTLDEASLIERLHVAAARSVPIVAHPDIIHDIKRWRTLGSLLCIENMDRRKTTGRTCIELARYLGLLTEARWCFDIGHAHQVDSTMSEAFLMIRSFRQRLGHMHASYVNSSGGHEAITYG